MSVVFLQQFIMTIQFHDYPPLPKKIPTCRTQQDPGLRHRLPSPVWLLWLHLHWLRVRNLARSGRSTGKCWFGIHWHNTLNYTSSSQSIKLSSTSSGLVITVQPVRSSHTRIPNDDDDDDDDDDTIPPKKTTIELIQMNQGEFMKFHYFHIYAINATICWVNWQYSWKLDCN